MTTNYLLQPTEFIPTILAHFIWDTQVADSVVVYVIPAPHEDLPPRRQSTRQPEIIPIIPLTIPTMLKIDV